VDAAREKDAWLVYVAIAISGATALAAEVIWTRILSLLYGGTVYTFALILAVFLLGLGIGSSIGSTLARSVERPRLARFLADDIKAQRVAVEDAVDRSVVTLRGDELFVAAKDLQAPYELVRQVAVDGRLPVVNFVAGGISTPADAALVMQLGSEGVFVGSGIFKSEDPARMANAIVQATTHFDDPKILADVSKGLGAPMRGLAMEAIPEAERLAVRGW